MPADRDLEIFEHGARRKLAGERGGLRAADRRAVAGDVDAAAASAVRVGVRQPLAERPDRSEAPRPASSASCVSGLSPKPTATASQGSDDLVSAAIAKAHRLDAVRALESRELNAVMHRHAARGGARACSQARARTCRGAASKIGRGRDLCAERRRIEHRRRSRRPSRDTAWRRDRAAASCRRTRCAGRSGSHAP